MYKVNINRDAFYKFYVNTVGEKRHLDIYTCHSNKKIWSEE